MIRFRKVLLIQVWYFSFLNAQNRELCPSLKNSLTVSVSCTFDDRLLANCINVPTGTRATLTCSDFYEAYDGSVAEASSICKNGKWENLVQPLCKPTCGRKYVTDPALIINGTNAKRGEYPWQTAIYNKHSQILLCGGSLINEKAVVTAAHCVSDHRGRRLSKDQYLIVAGKYYRNLNETKDLSNSQSTAVKVIHLPRFYKGLLQNYLGDIAVIETETAFVMSELVQPVCLDVSNSFIHLDHFKQKFSVSGWGYTQENGAPAEVLKSLKIPLVTHDICVKQIPEDYETYLTFDKICGGYSDAETSVCRGDSGGGLVMRYTYQYYLIGVVSNSPAGATLGCNSNQYALYTNVSEHIEFVSNLEKQLRPRQDIFISHATFPPPKTIQNYAIEEVCLGCICEAASGCNLKADCTNEKCGPFQLPQSFWVNSDKPTIDNILSGELCLKDAFCAAKSIRQYFAKYKQDCNNDGKLDCDDVALLLQNGGGSNCSTSLTGNYGTRYNTCREITSNLGENNQNQAQNTPSIRPAVTYYPDDLCLGCLCEAMSGCNITIGCLKGSCGPFILSKAFWIDAGKPTLENESPESPRAFEKCAADAFCSARAVRKYVAVYQQDCNDDGVIDCSDVVHLHLNGPYNCKKRLSEFVANRYSECIRVITQSELKIR